LPQRISDWEREKEQRYYRLAALVPISSVESLTMQNNPTLVWCEIVQRVILESGCGESHPDYRMLEEVKQESMSLVEADERWKHTRDEWTRARQEIEPIELGVMQSKLNLTAA
tara:strand:+ start:68 stop:406 length:339 start_codon:yes stop_codon:yes gene_type:complete